MINHVCLNDLDLRLRRLHAPSPAAIKSMEDSLKRHGQLSPIIACNDGQRLILADGFKRHSAAKAIGVSQLVAMTVNMGHQQAKALMHLVNRAKGFSIIQEAILVRELIEIDGLNQVETASLLDRHKSWVNRRLHIIRCLAPEIVDDLRLGLTPPGSAPSLARLPQCNQADLVATIKIHQLKPQQIRRLVDLWCKAKEPDYKQFLLKYPKEALGIISQPLNQWSKALSAIEQIAKSIQGAPPGNIGTIKQALDQAENACKASFEKIRNIMEEAR